MTPPQVPHLRIIIAFCAAAIVGYAIFSGWVVFYSHDAAQRGDVIGTWKSFAVAAFAFWLGSSSGGKARDAEASPATGKPDDPVNTKEVP
jgi:hypothetical protein